MTETLQKSDWKKFVKLTGHTYACNSLTKFWILKWTKAPETEILRSAEIWLKENLWNHDKSTDFVAGFRHLKPLWSEEALSLECIQCQVLAPVRAAALANMALRSALVVPGPRGPPKNVEECSVETISNYIYPRSHTHAHIALYWNITSFRYWIRSFHLP